MSRHPSLLATAFLFAFGACGGSKTEPSTPATSSADPAPKVADAPPPSSPSGDAAPQEPAPQHKHRPYEIVSSCGDVVTLAFGEDAKSPKTGKKTIAPSGTLDGPREADGSQSIWLLDAKGEPLVQVHVTKGMKRVEVGKSCRTLDAR